MNHSGNSDIADLASVTEDKFCEFKGCFVAAEFCLDIGINVYNPTFREVPFKLCGLHTRCVKMDIDDYHHCGEVLWELVGKNGLVPWKANELIYYANNIINAAAVILGNMKERMRNIMESCKIRCIPSTLYSELEIITCNLTLCNNIVSERHVYAIEKRQHMYKQNKQV
jgi:hypothetical protein